MTPTQIPMANTLVLLGSGIIALFISDQNIIRTIAWGMSFGTVLKVIGTKAGLNLVEQKGLLKYEWEVE